MPHPLPLAPTSSDFGEHHQVQTGSRNCSDGNRYRRDLSGYTYVFGASFSLVYNAALTRCFLHPEIPRWRTYTGSSYNFVTENNIKVILAAGAIFYVCFATEIASISVSVANLLVLPVLGNVSTSGLHLIVLSLVEQCRCWWRWIGRALKHCRSRWDHLDIIFRRKVITTSGTRPLSWNFWVQETSG